MDNISRWILVAIMIAITLLCIIFIFILYRACTSKVTIIPHMQISGVDQLPLLSSSDSNVWDNSVDSNITDDTKQDRLYYFNTKYCRHCILFAPEWKKIVESNSNIVCRSIDAADSKNEALVFYYNVTSVPTIIFVHNNQIFEYKGSTRTADSINEFIRNHVADSV